MKTGWRVGLEILAPSLLGAMVYAYFTQQLEAMPLFILSGYRAGILPSLLYTAAMEIGFHERWRPDSWQTVPFSTVAAGGATFLVSVLIGNFPERTDVAVIGISLVVGLMMGCLISLLSGSELVPTEGETRNAAKPRRSWLRWEGTFVDDDS